MMYQARLRTPVTDSDHKLGPEGAPVTLVEYGDFQCRVCGRAYPVIQRVQRSMHGLLRFVFRNFPLAEQHPDSMNGARAAESAGLQGRFWEMHNVLFLNQDYLDESSLFEYAAGLRLDLDRFERDMFSLRVKRKIGMDLQSGIRSGVNGTPTFFINGIRYDGEWVGREFMEALRSAAYGVEV